MEQLQIMASRHLGDRIRLEWFTRSHFSDVACFRNIDETPNGVVVKRILPWHLDTLSETERPETARLFNESTLHFRTLLLRHGVPVALTYECLYQNGHVFHISSEEGVSVQTCISRPKADQGFLIGLVIKAIYGVLMQKDQPVVGLDPQLDNFGVVPLDNGDVGVVYIDVFPPLCHFQGQYLVHYPNPIDPEVVEWELDRKFRPLGILRRLRFSVLSIDMALESIFYDKLQQYLPYNFYCRVAEFFESLPDAVVKNGFDHAVVGKMIEQIPLTGIDDIREVAMRLAYKADCPRKQFLAEVFDLSRKDPSPGHEESHLMRFDQLKKRLLSLI